MFVKRRFKTNVTAPLLGEAGIVAFLSSFVVAIIKHCLQGNEIFWLQIIKLLRGFC